MKKQTIPLILASGSPRRKDLLQAAGVDFWILFAQIDENQLEYESPTDYIVRMVATKAQACQPLLADFAPLTAQATDRVLILTADTIGVLKDDTQTDTPHKILQKPKNQADAFAMWQQMSGNTHHIWTAVQISLFAKTDQTWHMIDHQNLIEQTQVTFKTLDHAQMHAYWQTGEPLDKAGGYAIQGKGSAWIDQIEGSYSNVVGLPIEQTLDLINQYL